MVRRLIEGGRAAPQIRGQMLIAVIRVQFILNGTSVVFLGLLEKSRAAG